MPVYLIRHGQSEFNAAHNAGDKDPMIFDAPLTDKGRRQAEEAKALVANLGIRQVITSPLTRAIQTALCIYQTGHNVSFDTGDTDGPVYFRQHRTDLGCRQAS